MRHSTRRGMGASELLIALAVAAAVAFGFYQYVDARAEDEKRGLTIRRMTLIETALQRYCIDCAGALPSPEQTLSALVEKPRVGPVPRGWDGPYLKDPRALKDAWGREFTYICPGKYYPGSKIPRPYDLSSCGRDGREGGKGLDRDIRNWERETMTP